MPHRAAGRPWPAPVAIALVTLGLAATACSGRTTSTPAAEPVTLRLQVSLTPEELATFQPALEALDTAHPEWVVRLETVPQGSEVEKVTAELAGDDLPTPGRHTSVAVAGSLGASDHGLRPIGG